MKIHILQHVAFEGPGMISDWAVRHGHSLSYTKFFEAFSIPLPVDIDFLIVLGGPMGVQDGDRYPWLNDEMEYIRQMLKTNCKVLGICLGAQLIAHALDAAVYPNEFKEIGWFPVKKNKRLQQDFLADLPDELPAFHWHGDTFNLPRGAKRLFSSEASPNQGFVFNERVVALQFHWEITKDSVKQLIDNSGDELSGGKYVQSADELFSREEAFAVVHQYMEKVLDYLVRN